MRSPVLDYSNTNASHHSNSYLWLPFSYHL